MNQFLRKKMLPSPDGGTNFRLEKKKKIVMLPSRDGGTNSYWKKIYTCLPTHH